MHNDSHFSRQITHKLVRRHRPDTESSDLHRHRESGRIVGSVLTLVVLEGGGCTSVDKWRTELDGKTVEQLKPLLDSTLKRYGYG